VLIGAGDQDYLAVAGLSASAAFAAAAAAMLAVHGGGLVSLWLAPTPWLLARFGTLVPRARSTRRLVTGALRP